MPHDPNAKYHEVGDAAHWHDHFRRPGRGVWEHRERLLADMQLRPGMVVLDVGAGPGTFVPALLDAVGDGGRVHAVEVAEPFVERLRELARVHANLSVHLTPADVAPDSVDLAICIDTYHHLHDPRAVMRATARSLAPGGRLLLVDLRLDEHSAPQLREHVRADRSTVERELAEAGFALVERLPDLAENYVLRLRLA